MCADEAKSPSLHSLSASKMDTIESRALPPHTTYSRTLAHTQTYDGRTSWDEMRATCCDRLDEQVD